MKTLGVFGENVKDCLPSGEKHQHPSGILAEEECRVVVSIKDARHKWILLAILSSLML
jgi:hypothetical protein